MNNIRSKQHNMYSITTNKISLNSCDNKRYQLDDGTSSLAYGHYKITKPPMQAIIVDHIFWSYSIS